MWAACLLLAVFLASGVFLSCGTPPPGRFKRAMLVGVVLDSKGRPVSGADVRLDRIRRAQTGMNGRFAFDGVRRGERSLLVSEPGFEEAQIELDFADRRQIVYVRLVSRRTLLEHALSAVERGQLEAADAALSRAAAVEDPDTDLDIVFLRAIVAYRRGEISRAAGFLEELRADPRSRPVAEALAAAASAGRL